MFFFFLLLRKVFHFIVIFINKIFLFFFFFHYFQKAFEDNGLKVTVDYQRDETIGYVHLHLPMAKEVVNRITTSGGLRIGSEYVVLRALEGNYHFIEFMIIFLFEYLEYLFF